MDSPIKVDIKSIKELSWYLTVPLITVAYILQTSDISSVLGAVDSTTATLQLLSGAFFKVLGGLFFLFVFLLYIGTYEKRAKIPFLLIIATFILTVAIFGLAMYWEDFSSNKMPYNVFWFFGFMALAFNIYQLAEQ